MVESRTEVAEVELNSSSQPASSETQHVRRRSSPDHRIFEPEIDASAPPFCFLILCVSHGRVELEQRLTTAQSRPAVHKTPCSQERRQRLAKHLQYLRRQ